MHKNIPCGEKCMQGICTNFHTQKERRSKDGVIIQRTVKYNEIKSEHFTSVVASHVSTGCEVFRSAYGAVIELCLYPN